MIHVTIPVTAQGEPIPLVKLGQGRNSEHESGPLETPKTFAEKLRAAGYQEPTVAVMNAHLEKIQDQRKAIESPTPPPVVSREGFRAGMLSAILGCVALACVFILWGAIVTAIVAAACVGFVAGMVLTQEWK